MKISPVDMWWSRRNRRVTLRWIFVMMAFAAIVVITTAPANATPFEYEDYVASAAPIVCAQLDAVPNENGLAAAHALLMVDGATSMEASQVIWDSINGWCDQHAEWVHQLVEQHEGQIPLR